MSDVPDPLGIRAATAWVMERAEDVAIEENGVKDLAARLSTLAGGPPSWRVAPHWWDAGDPSGTATYVLVLDALNFSFWGEPGWRVRWNGADLNGYWALAAALLRGLKQGVPLLDAAALRAGVDAALLLRGEDGVRIPLLDERAAILREVGEGLERSCGGSFLRCLDEAHGSAAALVERVVALFPSFRDVAIYQGRSVPFYKRAQILAADLWGALDGKPPSDFHDLAALTMFADYKVPQVLQHLGVLRYSERLVDRLRRCHEIASGDPMDVEIRAGSIHAIERVCDRLAQIGARPTAAQIDWQLWLEGQSMDMSLPYHRTRTVFY